MSASASRPFDSLSSRRRLKFSPPLGRQLVARFLRAKLQVRRGGEECREPEAAACASHSPPLPSHAQLEASVPAVGPDLLSKWYLEWAPEAAAVVAAGGAAAAPHGGHRSRHAAVEFVQVRRGRRR